MKVKYLVAAVAATMVAPSAMAAALTAANVIYVSGATAQTPALAKSVSNFCSGTVTTYTDSVDGKSGFVYYCTAANTAKSGLTGDFLIVKNDGGSSQGVAPVVNKTLVAFPDITNCTASTTPITGTNTTNIAGTFAGTCVYSSTVLNVIPQVGLTDVPDNIWTARGAFTPSIPTSAYTTKGNFGGQGFGVAVSDKLYLAMQLDQVAAGYLASTCATATTTTATINTSVACQPSIGKEQYAALVGYNPGSAYHADWSRLLTHTTLTATSAPSNLDVISVCRRSNGSGTQASSDIYFLHSPCNSLTALGGAVAPTPAGAYDFSTGLATTVAGNVSYVVTEQASTGGVKTCLQGTTGNAVVGTAPYAIGVMSLENPQPASGWKWLKLNGVSPNVEATQKATVVDGEYNFAFDSELLYRNDTAANAQAFANNLVTELGNGANLTTFAGVYAGPQSGATPVAGQTHMGSQGGNACRVHVLN